MHDTRLWLELVNVDFLEFGGIELMVRQIIGIIYIYIYLSRSYRILRADG